MSNKIYGLYKNGKQELRGTIEELKKLRGVKSKATIQAYGYKTYLKKNIDNDNKTKLYLLDEKGKPIIKEKDIYCEFCGTKLNEVEDNKFFCISCLLEFDSNLKPIVPLLY